MSIIHYQMIIAKNKKHPVTLTEFDNVLTFLLLLVVVVPIMCVIKF